MPYFAFLRTSSQLGSMRVLSLTTGLVAVPPLEPDEGGAEELPGLGALPGALIAGGEPPGLEPLLGGLVVPGGGLPSAGGLIPPGGGEVPSGSAGGPPGPGGVRPGRALGFRIGSCGMICRSPGLTGVAAGLVPGTTGRGTACGSDCGGVAAVINTQRGR